MTQQNKLRLEIPPQLTASYSNATIITQTNSEFVYDFIQILPSDPRAKVQTRVVMTPTNAKLFMRALEQNIRVFEEKHGEISVPPQPVSLADHLFGMVKQGEGGQDDASASVSETDTPPQNSDS